MSDTVPPQFLHCVSSFLLCSLVRAPFALHNVTLREVEHRFNPPKKPFLTSFIRKRDQEIVPDHLP